MERERRSREYWEQELSEYWDSGLTVQEYSELKELPYESVRRWIRRLKQERPGVAKVDFVEVKAPSVSAQRAPSGFEIASVLCFFQPRTTGGRHGTLQTVHR